MPRGYALYDPHKTGASLDSAYKNIPDSHKVLMREAEEMGARIISERKAAGVPEKDVFTVPVIHRITKDRKTERPILRFLDLSPNYAGRLSNCEQLVLGDWRLASPEEVADAKAFEHEKSIEQDEAELLRLQRVQDQQNRRMLDASDRLEQRQLKRLAKKEAERPAAMVSEKPAAVADEKTKAPRK